MNVGNVGMLVRERIRKAVPIDESLGITDGELSALLLCNLVTTVGLAGDIARHLRDPANISNDFVSGWHLVLYGGVLAVGLWLGLGAIRRGPAFVSSASGTAIGFLLLSLGGICDAAWHHAFGTEAAVEALVSPPHLVVFSGLVFLLTSPLVVLWKRPARRLGFVASLAALVSLVSAVLVTELFTGFLSPLAGGLSLQPGYVEPLIGESLQDYDQVRGLGIAVWTVALVVAAFTVVWVRFRLLPGMTFLGFVLIGVPAFVVDGGGIGWHSPIRPLVVGFAVAGLVAEAMVALLGKPTLGRFAASLTGAMVGAMLWAATFAELDQDGRLLWNQSLWGGTVTLSALVGAAVAALVALPAPTGDSVVDSPLGPRPA
ncbi:MAG: hypothetical protein JWM89_3995 [Acidimicrobiales bacterium]|nr:hypothetical protein [Acidimicrobiales bacterium]